MTIIKTFDTTDNQNQFSPRYIFLAAFCLIALMVVEIWANNTIVTYGAKYDNLSKLQQAIRLENQILENEIAKRSSLSTIASESAVLGFSQIENIQYIQ